MGPGVVLASRLVGAMRGVPVGEGLGIGGCSRGRYAVTLTRLSTEPVTKKVPNRWKATAVIGRVWPALPKEAVVPVAVGSGVVLVNGVVDTVTDIPVNAGPNIAVPVDVRTGVVLTDRETGTVLDVPVNAEVPVEREVNAGSLKLDRDISTEVDAVCGVPVSWSILLLKAKGDTAAPVWGLALSRSAGILTRMLT